MSSSRGEIRKVTTLMDYFREELIGAFGALGLQTSTETEAYLVHLLEGYSRVDAGSIDEIGFHKPAAKLLEEAMESHGERRIEIFRRLGDASLYSCGFFNERLSRRTMTETYYRRVGRTAYRSLGEMMQFKQPGGAFQTIFEELAHKFDDVVDAFRFLSIGSEDAELQVVVERYNRGEDIPQGLLNRFGLLKGNKVGLA